MHFIFQNTVLLGGWPKWTKLAECHGFLLHVLRHMFSFHSTGTAWYEWSLADRSFWFMNGRAETTWSSLSLLNYWIYVPVLVYYSCLCQNTMFPVLFGEHSSCVFCENVKRAEYLRSKKNGNWILNVLLDSAPLIYSIYFLWERREGMRLPLCFIPLSLLRVIYSKHIHFPFHTAAINPSQ